MSHIIPNQIFIIQTDACDQGIGGLLYQYDGFGNPRIISVVSRCLTGEEKNYTTCEKELLAIVYSVTKFRVYVLGISFKILTDHQSLTFLESTKYQSSRLIRWSLVLQQYTYQVSYCRGEDNVFADFLSRYPEGKFRDAIKENTALIANLTCYTATQRVEEYPSFSLIAMVRAQGWKKEKFNKIGEKQKSDAEINKYIECLARGEKVECFQIYNGVLFHQNKKGENWAIMVPKELTKELIEKVHEKLGHPGAFKTTKYLQQYYFWAKMRRQVKDYVKTCDTCQRVKNLTVAMEGEFEWISTQNPNELATLDFYVPLPPARAEMQYILVVMDAFQNTHVYIL